MNYPVVNARKETIVFYVMDIFPVFGIADGSARSVLCLIRSLCGALDPRPTIGQTVRMHFISPLCPILHGYHSSSFHEATFDLLHV